MTEIQDIPLAAPDSQNYRHVIPKYPNLLARWSTPADIPKIGRLCGTVFKSKFFTYWITNVMDPNPSKIFMSPYDTAVVEDITTGEIIASTCLYAHEFEYEGTPYSVGRAEMVATDPRYRKRGLMHVIFKMIHARSEKRGDKAQMVGGLENFYRQFGYEYAIGAGNDTVTTEIVNIPKAKPDEEELVDVRDAVTAQDVQDMTEIYESMNLLHRYTNWVRMPPGYLEMYVARPGTVPSPPEGTDELELGLDAHIDIRHRRAVLVTDLKTTKTIGFVVIANTRRGPSISISLLGFHHSISVPAIFPSFLRAIARHGLTVPPRTASEPDFSKITWYISGYHPISPLVRAHAAVPDSTSAYWMRVPNMPQFLLHVAPVLERRLAQSAFANHTGELRISFYRGGVKITLVAGRIANVEDGDDEAWDDTDVSFPPLMFLKCLFGYKSLDEMTGFLDDVQCDKAVRPLFEALFPKEKGSCFEFLE